MSTKCYKGFDKNLKCRGYQYEVGKDYEEESADLCNRGFHACENPLDVFGYYPPSDGRFCEVELDEVSDKRDKDSKICGKKIHIGAEIGLTGLIQSEVKFVLDRADWENAKETNTRDQSTATNTGDQSAATNTGYRSAATNTGNQSAATNTGNQSAATNTGYRSAATNTGYQSTATNTGRCSAATNTGDQSATTNTGDRSAATNAGYRSAATNIGYQSTATNIGDQSTATNTGYQSTATNTGDQSAATNTGRQSTATNTGDQSAATNTGRQSTAVVSGEQSVAISVGIKGKAKGALGCFIVVAEWEQDNDYNWNRKAVKSAEVDGTTIKADTFYTLQDGNFVEVEEWWKLK